MLWVLLLLTALPGVCLAQKAVTVSCDKPIRGYQDNVLCAECAFPGLLTLSVTDEFNEWAVICRDYPVEAGQNEIVWNGLGTNLERIDDGKYTFSALLSGADGRVEAADSAFTLSRCRQAVIFALPSAEEAYRDGSWYVELKMVRAGTLVTEFYHAEDMSAPFYVKRRPITSLRVQKWEWEGKIAGKPIPAGDYVIRFYAEETPGFAHDVHVALRDGQPVARPVTPTGPVMPQDGASDTEIWALMTAPAVVVDIRNINHQKVYETPSAAGRSLGTLHGQSQSLEVLEVLDSGWARIAAWQHEDGGAVTGYVPLNKLKVVQPQTRYGLLVDKRSQTLTVYEHGERLGTIWVSSGLKADKKAFRETAAGSFLTQEHMSDYSTNGKKFQYVIRYDGGNLLHSIAYETVRDRRSYARQEATLGQKASNACLRIQHAPGENGLNAYWIWTHIPAGTRVIVLDDPLERAGEKEDDPQGWTAVPPLAAGETEVVLTLGGDTVLGTREAWQEMDGAFPSVVEARGGDWLMANLLELFSQDDLTLLNLECTLKDDPEGEDRRKEYRFRGRSEYAGILARNSVEAVNIANNHVIDYGSEGREATIAALEAAGVAVSGYGRLWTADIRGCRIGFGGCRETVYKADRNVIRRDISALKAMGCSAVVYSCHWGTEYSGRHTALQRTMAEAAVSAGADLVVGTHPHVVQGIDRISDSVVLYSLGNLLFGGTHEMKTFDGLICQVRLRFDGQGRLAGIGLKLVPVLTSSSSAARVNDFQPVPAAGGDSNRILAAVQSDSGLLIGGEMYFPLGK